MTGPGCRAVVVPSATRTQTTLAATVAGARHVPVGWTVLVECVSRKRDALRDSADGTRLAKGETREGTAGNRGVGLVFGKTKMALLANFQLTRAPRRAYGGRAAVARLPSHMPRRSA